MKIFSKLSELMKKSCERNNETSSTRIIAYIITVLIVFIVLTSISTGIYIAITSKVIPNEIIIILGMLLAHQLTLLGINKYHETKQTSTENKVVDENVVDENVVVDENKSKETEQS